MNPLLHPLLDTLFAWVWRTSIAATILALLVLGVERLCQKRLPARWLYALWICVLLRLMMPHVPSAPFSILNWLALSRDNPFSPTMSLRGSSGANSFSEPLESAAAAPGDFSVATETGLEKSTPAQLGGSSQINPDTARQWVVFDLLAYLWFSGAILFLGGVFAQHWKFSRWLKTRPPLTAARVLTLIEEGKLLLHIRSRIAVLETNGPPALFGAFKPHLLLPRNIAENFSDAELRHIILHELVHLKRRDVLLNWLIILVQSLHWFNPFVWLAMRRLRAARELACDAAVLTRLPADQRTSYGSTLIKILDSCSKMSAAPSLLPILNRKEQLHRRIRMIAHYKPSTRLAAFASTLLLLALGCLTFTRAANKPALAPPAPTQSSAAESDADFSLRKISPALASRPDDTAERLAYYQLRLDLLKERHMQAADLVRLRQAREDYRNAWVLMTNVPPAISTNQFEKIKTDMETIQATVDERARLLTDVGRDIDDLAFARLSAKGAATTQNAGIESPKDLATARHQIVVLEELLGKEEEAIRKKQDQIDRMKMEFGISQSEESQSGLSSEALRKLEAMRLETRGEYEKLNNLYIHLVDLPSSEFRRAIGTASPDAHLATLEDNLATAEQKLAALSSTYAAEHPEVRSVQRLRDTISKQIDARLAGILEGLKARKASQKAALDQLTAQVEKARKSDIADAISRRPYFQAKRDLEIMQQTHDQLLTRLSQLRIDAALAK